MACACFYGLLETAAKLQNPFGHDMVDWDMGDFGKKMHDETRAVSITAGTVDNRDYTCPPEVTEV